MDNVIICAIGANRRRVVVTRPAWLYDYGMKLKIVGLELPTAYEVDFAHSKTETATRMVGDADGVDIPNALFESGTQILAWLYVHEDLNDGYTVYEIKIPLLQRPHVNGAEPTPAQQDAIDVAIAALNDAIERTSADVVESDANAERAENAAEAAEASATAASSSETNVRNYANQAASSASSAASSASTATAQAQAAASSAISAANAASSAANSAEAAETARQQAESEKEAAQTARTGAERAETNAGSSALAAANSASVAATSAGNASESATQATESANNAQASATAAAGSATAAAGSATNAQEANTNAQQAKTDALDAKTAAEAARDRAEAAAQTLVLDPTLTSATQAAQAKAVGDIVADVLETEYTQELIAQNTTDNPTALEHITGYLVAGDGNTAGNLSGTGNTTNHTWYLLADNDMDVYPVPITQTTKCRIGIFNNSPYGIRNRVTPVYQSGNADFPLPTASNPLHVSAGQYVSISFYNADENPLWELYKIVDVTYALKSSTPLTDTQNDEVDTKIKNTATGDGYLEIDGTWARGEWTSYTNHSSRTYRVRLEEPISFDHDVYLMASPGFFFTGIFENGKTFNGERLGYVLRANEKAKISVRRINETSSEIADIDVFSLGVKVATLCAGIEKYRPTFTDISMFERVGVCGDSYASGGGIISGIRPLTWGKNLERQAGITVDIYAKSGQDVVAWVTDSTNGLPALLAGAECGLYWLQHGINGTSTPERLGTPADMSASPRPATFYGQYTEAIEQIKSAFPNARIVLATITGSSYWLYQTTYSGVNTAIRNIAQYCEVPVVDVVDDDFYKSLWYSSSIRSNHPTAMLCAGMAMANRRLVSKCIMDNPDYFVNYGSN